MRLPQASPGEGGKRSNSEHWSYWEVGGGEKHFAYIAGPTQWFVVHPSSRTKPCLTWMTNGSIACARCAQEKPTDECGYVPLWRGVDWRPLFVVVFGPEREHIDQFALHQRVVIGREKGVGARVWIRTAIDQEPKFNTTVARRREAQDITDSLITIWNIAELRVWLSSRHGVSDNAVSHAPEKLEGTNDDVPATARKDAVSSYARPGDGAMLSGSDEAVNRLLQHARRFGDEPSSNGKPKPKG